MIPIKNIKVHPNNPRLIKDDQFQKLCSSLKAFPEMMRKREILIEADGSYWHSKLNTQFRDRRKDDWCKLNNYELFRIDELKFYKDKRNASKVIIDRMKKLDPEIIIKKNGVNL